jgi:hypothetical protein
MKSLKRSRYLFEGKGKFLNAEANKVFELFKKAAWSNYFIYADDRLK